MIVFDMHLNRSTKSHNSYITSNANSLKWFHWHSHRVQLAGKKIYKVSSTITIPFCLWCVAPGSIHLFYVTVIEHMFILHQTCIQTDVVAQRRNCLFISDSDVSWNPDTTQTAPMNTKTPLFISCTQLSEYISEKLELYNNPGAILKHQSDFVWNNPNELKIPISHEM